MMKKLSKNIANFIANKKTSQELETDAVRVTSENQEKDSLNENKELSVSQGTAMTNQRPNQQVMIMNVSNANGVQIGIIILNF